MVKSDSSGIGSDGKRKNDTSHQQVKKFKDEKAEEECLDKVIDCLDTHVGSFIGVISGTICK